MSGFDAAAATLPDEVVTSSHIRTVDLPDGAGRMALITLDNGIDHTRPSTLGPEGLRRLAAALDMVEAAARAGDVVAVGLVGKPFVFLAGADLRMIKSGADRDHALGIARLGHALFRRLGGLGVPSFAYVNGAALGGGLELALHCTYRTMSSGVTAVALPECFLGIIPGWGGAYLLPTLVGVERALEVIVTNPLSSNRMLDGRAASRLGIADVLLEPADFLEESLRWTAGVVTGRIEISRAPVDRDEGRWTAATAAARSFVASRVGGAAPAPYRALDLVDLARTADADTAFAAEDEALADLSASQELHASLYAFDLVQKRARRPAGAPDPALARPVTKVGVVGAGLMARQLALLAVRRLRVPVVLTDVDEERVARGVAEVHGRIADLVRRGRIRQDEANRLTALVRGGTDPGIFTGADVVVEAVFEDLLLKKKVFAELESVVPESCLLLTNTSSLSVDAMAADLAHPERVVGFHVFNPVAVMPLVEVVRGRATDDAALATALALATAVRKSPVLVADTPAFVVNRLLTRLTSQVTAAVDEGTDPAVVDRSLAPLGLPMAPFQLLQLVGPPVVLHVQRTLHAAFPDRFAVSATLERLVAAGRPGLWSLDENGAPYLDDETRALLVQGDRRSSAEEVRDRVLCALAEEARILLDEGVVASPLDIDLCMILGAGWPFHLGGITPYLDREGISEAVTGRRFLPPGIATLP